MVTTRAETSNKEHSSSKDGGNHPPAIAAVRLAQEASDLRRRPVSNGLRGVRDVTQEFISATDRLPLGELVKDDHFTLFEAVGALEVGSNVSVASLRSSILSLGFAKLSDQALTRKGWSTRLTDIQIMDPKMDSGYVPQGDHFEPDFDSACGLGADEVLWIMEQLFRFEMTFHDGYPLSQNIFTSLHIFSLISPENRYPYSFHPGGALPQTQAANTQYNLVHVVLRAYCIAVLKCCEITLKTIQSQTFYEEEDFVTFLFGRELLPRSRPEEAQHLLIEAMEWLDDASVDPSTKRALLCHLETRQSALECMNDAKQQWNLLRSNVEKLEHEELLSKPVPSAFSDKVQRQLATSTPPRPMPDLTWKDACTKWKQLCDDVLAAYYLTQFQIRRSPRSLLNATWAFAYRDPPPNTFSRAKMQDILTGNDTFGDDILHIDHLLCDIRELVLAGDSLADPASFHVEVPSDPRHVCSRLIEEFMARALGEYLNLFRMICQNRCRMRRLFTQALPLLDDIETEAQATDQRLNEIIVPRTVTDESGTEQALHPLTIWSRLYKLQMMAWVIQLGFETDIYLPEELGNMYMLVIDFTDRRRDELKYLELLNRTKLESLSGPRNRIQQQQYLATWDWLRGAVLAVDIDLALASALSHLYIALEMFGVIDVTSKPYSNVRFQYEARTKPLLNLPNDKIPDIELLLQQKRDLSGTVSETCAQVKSFVSAAKARIAELKGMRSEQVKQVGTEDQWRAELKRLETVCVAITVTASQLVRISSKHGKSDTKVADCLRHVIEATLPPPGRRYHDWWIVPQVNEKTSR